MKNENGTLLATKRDLWFRKKIHIESIVKLQSSQQSITHNGLTEPAAHKRSPEDDF